MFSTKRKKWHLILGSVALVFCLFFIKSCQEKDNDITKNLRYGPIKEEAKQEDKKNIIVTDKVKFSKQDDDKEIKKDESGYYKDKYGLIYRRRDLPNMGISTMVPINWNINTEDPNFIYLQSNDDENYRIVEIALFSTLRSDNWNPSTLAANLYSKIYSKYKYHPYRFTMYPESLNPYPEGFYVQGDNKVPVWSKEDTINGFMEFPIDKKPQNMPGLNKTIKFLAYAYDEEGKFIRVNDGNTSGNMHYSHRYMALGEDQIQFIGVTGPTAIRHKIKEIANTMVAFAEPYKVKEFRTPSFNQKTQVFSSYINVPDGYNEIYKDPNTLLLRSDRIDDISTGVNISFFKVGFSAPEFKTLDPRAVEYRDALVRALSPIKENEFQEAISLDKNNVGITPGTESKISDKTKKYKRTIVYTKIKDSVSEYSLGIDFPTIGNLYIINTGNDESHTYGLFIPYNNTNEKYVDLLGDNLMKQLENL